MAEPNFYAMRPAPEIPTIASGVTTLCVKNALILAKPTMPTNHASSFRPRSHQQQEPSTTPLSSQDYRACFRPGSVSFNDTPQQSRDDSLWAGFPNVAGPEIVPFQNEIPQETGYDAGHNPQTVEEVTVGKNRYSLTEPLTEDFRDILISFLEEEGNQNVA